MDINKEVDANKCPQVTAVKDAHAHPIKSVTSTWTQETGRAWQPNVHQLYQFVCYNCNKVTTHLKVRDIGGYVRSTWCQPHAESLFPCYVWCSCGSQILVSVGDAANNHKQSLFKIALTSISTHMWSTNPQDLHIRISAIWYLLIMNSRAIPRKKIKHISSFLSCTFCFQYFT
jgi:hypothetical protein